MPSLIRRVAALTRCMPGEQANGDGFLLRSFDAQGRSRWSSGSLGPEGSDPMSSEVSEATTLAEGERLLMAVIDGTGHGPEAAEATARIVESLMLWSPGPRVELPALFEDCHRAAHGSRGAALAVAWLDFATGEATACGVGSVRMELSNPSPTGRHSQSLSSEATAGSLVKDLTTSGGIVGYRMPPRIYENREFLEAGDVIALWSDGVEFEWDRGLMRLARSDPDAAIDEIRRRFFHARDDATIAISV
ncbi:MAG: SpoIIE family protein phosphatase [Myxococcales bacterium]|nr:SpoIIE family protein phosphatase [Myxococcales bacterium]